MSSDWFYKSDTVKRGVGVLIGVCFAGLLSLMTWNIAKTAELEIDIKVYKLRTDDIRTDVKEIKSDLKTLLERRQP